jgi:hypothetical protein
MEKDLHMRLVRSWIESLLCWNLSYNEFPGDDYIQGNIRERGGHTLSEQEYGLLGDAMDKRSKAYWNVRF